MLKKSGLVLFIILATLTGKNITVSGYVRDASSGEALIGANVYVTLSGTGAVTNNYGFYSLTVSGQDSIEIKYMYIGYKTQSRTFSVQRTVRQDIALTPIPLDLGTVLVSGQVTKNYESKRMSTIDIPMRTIELMPAIMGEADLLKAVQLLPGVQSGAEGTTGYYVRGGNSDQNLVLLDEATIYNPNHLFGLLSTFNSKAINNVTLIKGGFPADYGGRLSSTIDITMKEGNDKQYNMDLGIGLINSEFTLQGPLIKNRFSFILSARRTYLDLLLKPFPKLLSTTYKFYDLNGKVNYKLTDKDRLFMSYFRGRDKAGYVAANSLNYDFDSGNSTTTFRWNHIVNDKLFLNASLIHNSYLMDLKTIQNSFYGEFYSQIEDQGGKLNFEYFVNPGNTLKFGYQTTRHRFTPTGTSGKVPVDSTVILLDQGIIQTKLAHEQAIYINEGLDATERLGMNLGFRFSLFKTGSTRYRRIEPRATVKFTMHRQSSIKLSYTIMNQFVHLVPSSTASIPTDIWLPSSEIVKPEHSQQIACGYFQNIQDNLYELSIESYYKTMDNQVAFKEGTRLMEQTNIDSQLVFGKGWSYGMEFFLKKNAGKLYGWLSYTLSWTHQQFPDLNSGKIFPFKYDRRHNLSVVGVYKLNEYWTLSSIFVFTSGSVMTLPGARVAVYEGGDLYNGVFDVYSGKNNYRLNPYHRMDVALTYKHSQQLFHQHYAGELILSLYNAYNHLNPYFVYVDVEPGTHTAKAKQVSLLPIIPSISYNLHF